MDYFKENYNSPSFQKGPTFSRGEGGVVQLLIPYIKLYRNPLDLSMTIRQVVRDQKSNLFQGSRYGDHIYCHETWLVFHTKT